jgi:hypothetical protein
MIVIGSSIWMAVDANDYGKRYGVRGPSMAFGLPRPGDQGAGPLPWFLFGFLLWIVGFPLYLVRRSKTPIGAVGFCTKCGNPLAPGTKFCVSCGAPA